MGRVGLTPENGEFPRLNFKNSVLFLSLRDKEIRRALAPSSGDFTHIFPFSVLLADHFPE